MIKKIGKNELKLGMYLHSLNCGWLDHPFVRSSFMLRKSEDLQRILTDGPDYVFIDTLKGLDCPPAPSWEEAQEQLRDHLAAALPQAPPATGGQPPALTSFLEELDTAREVKLEADQLIRSLMHDVRLGRNIRMEEVHPVVLHITESILRNPGTLVSLCRLREADTFTFQHSVSVSALLVLFSHSLGLDLDTIHALGVGGMLHDIGKMRVPDHILNKPSRLTPAEYEVMKTHVPLGLDTLAHTPGITDPVLQVTGEHHERRDGSGYPGHLKEDAISLPGRMAAIVDVYDAITSTRVYHRGLEPSHALRQLFLWGRHYFDEDLVQRFVQALGIYPVGSLVRLESQRLAVVLEQNQGGLLCPKVRVVYDAHQRRALPPADLDLSRQDSVDRILGPEDPLEWGLDPGSCLQMQER